MSKNSSSPSKKPSGGPGREKTPVNSSTRSRRAVSGSATHTRKSGTPATSRKQTSKGSSLRDQAFDLAITLANRGEAAEAVTLLELLIKQYPDDWAIHWYLGGLYLHRLDQPDRAIPIFRRTVGWRPRSEKSSLGLFHSLWRLDRHDEALEELKRFQVLTRFKSKDYREIIAEINEKWSDAPPAKKKQAPRGGVESSPRNGNPTR